MSELSIEFTSPAGEEIRFDWTPEALAGLDPSDSTPPWTLAGELDWDEIERVRVFSGRLGDGLAVAIASLVPAGAGGHGDGPIAGMLIKDAIPEQLGEVRVSTEYGPDSIPRRVGLELHRDDAGIPLRMAADATGHETSDEGGLTRERVTLALRSAGVEGVAVLETLERK